MHDDGGSFETRIDRFVPERLQPAVYPAAVPARVERLGGSRVSPSRSGTPSRRRSSRVRGGHRLGPTVGHDLVPGHRARSRRDGRDAADTGRSWSSTSASPPGIPGFQAEGWSTPPRASIIKAVEPLNASVPLAASHGGRSSSTSRRASNPDLAGTWTFAPTALGDQDTAGDQPSTACASVDVALRDVAVWELLQDFDAARTATRSCRLDPAAARRDPARARARARRGGPATMSPARRRPAATCSPSRRSPRRPARARTGSTRSGTRTSTAPGCGRSARRCASSPAPSRTSSR